MEERDLLLSPQMLQQLGKQLGYSNAIPPQFVELASTLLMGGMAKKADNDADADELLKNLDTNGDGYLDEIEREGANMSDADKKQGLLDNLLGNKLDPLAEAFAQATGLPKDKAKKLMMMLAPVLLAMVAQKVSAGQGNNANRREVAKEARRTYKNPPRSREEFKLEQERLRLEEQEFELEKRRKELQERKRQLEQRRAAVSKNRQTQQVNTRRGRYQTPNKDDGGLLEKLLDRDGDGSFVDEATQILRQLLLR